METTVTKKEFDELAGSVKKIADLVEKNQGQHNQAIEQMVKDALANHPGITPGRIVKSAEAWGNNRSLAAIKDIREEEILHSMPKEMQSEMDNVFILSMLLQRNPRQTKSWGRFERMAGDFVKALDTAASGGGSDWVPTDFSPTMQEFIRVNGLVTPLFPQFTMPSSPWKLPVQIGALSTFKQPEQTADTGQTKIPVGDTGSLTGNATFTAVGHATRVLTSKDLEEDSIVPILPFLQGEIARAIAEGREDAILNGDTAGSHEDSDITSSSDRKKLFLGLRASANDNSYKTDLGTLSLDTLRSMRGNMGKYGTFPSQLAFVVGVKGYMKLLGLDEVRTVDKYGPNATVLRGELANLDGIPVIVSDQVRETLNASGVYDGVTSTKGVIYLVHRGSWGLGVRRGIATQLLTEIYAESDQDALLVRERIDFEPLRAAASNHTVELGYNLTV